MGSVVVLILAYFVVSYGVSKSGINETMDEAMDVPIGEFGTMGIEEAETESEGYVLYMNDLKLYESREKTGTMCSANLQIYFPKKKNAKLVMKLRYNIGPFLAKPLREMTAAEALKPESRYMMINSLKEGYAERYGITNITKVMLNDFTCRELD